MKEENRIQGYARFACAAHRANGGAVAAARKSVKLSAEQLAAGAGIRLETLQAIEAGRLVGGRVLIRLADFLGVQATELVAA